MIGRFARYAERRWNFLDILENVHDTRQNPSVPISAVFLSVFGMHADRDYLDADGKLGAPYLRPHASARPRRRTQPAGARVFASSPF